MANNVPNEYGFVKIDPRLLKFIEDQRQRVQRILDKHPNDSKAQLSLPGVVRRYDSLEQYINELLLEINQLKAGVANAASSLSSNTSSQKIDLTPSDLKDLPEELLKNLSLTDSDFFDFQILGIIESGGGVMSLDHILIGLYKDSGEVYDRLKISQKLYRMISKGKLFSVDGMKGVYSLKPQEKNEGLEENEKSDDETESFL